MVRQPRHNDITGYTSDVARKCTSVKSVNFEFLRKSRPELATLGAFAEQYASSDPTSACLKLRIFVEQLVEAIYDSQRFEKPYRAMLNDLLNESLFTELVPDVILQKIHTIRIRGNKAAHGEMRRNETAIALIKEVFDVSRWFYATFDGGTLSDIAAFQAPSVGGDDSKGQLKREKKALLQKLNRQEAQLAQLLTEIEQERKEREKLERASEAEREAAKAASAEVVNELDFNEAQTRKFLIDTMLVEAGWDVSTSGDDTATVGQEIKVTGQPTPSGDGYADYVLWGDDGKPLAVIEAKKTAKSAKAGRTQAKFYADALEAQYGQRPVIFYTNGITIFIEDDVQKYPPRPLYGFYSKDSLEYLHFQRDNSQALELVPPKADIAGRMYQLEAVKQVTERFSEGHRKALIVQATGTGKTRVAISICDVMIRAKRAKRILFLCDRRELRKQADNAYKEFLPTEPRVFISAKTSSDRDKRVYLATYPAMMKCFQSFDVGFFDLIIADESHRSIYNKYRDLFRYFDACQLGLTATPLGLIGRDTYQLFGCEDKDPTANYSISDAIEHSPPYLTPFRIVEVTTKFQRDGIKYSLMSEEEKLTLEQQCEDAESIEHEAKDLDKRIFNKDTTRTILRNLMEDGIRDTSGSLPGKTIIFARNHLHAEHLAEVFAELYPKYGGNFCKVIDNYDPRASQLIDDFKDPANELRIAVSVDMLDTGIDVPEIVNLVFAKPIKSYVKFWQMIGRGTRLCLNLFGPGNHKKEFVIFDHWGNFEYFGEDYKEQQPPIVKSLMQNVFEGRVELARVALEEMDEKSFRATIDLIQADVNTLKATKAIEVRDRWSDILKLSTHEALTAFAAGTHAGLIDIVAPLMRWCDVRGHEDAYRFDLRCIKLQIAKLEKSGSFADVRAEVEDDVEALSKRLNQVKAKSESIKKVRSAEFWDEITPAQIEELRVDLRGIMKHKAVVRGPRLEPRVIDLDDKDIERVDRIPTFEGHDLIAYRQRVTNMFKESFENDPTLAKIRAGYAVSDADLDVLARKVLTVDPQVNLKHLPVQIHVKGDLHKALRSIVGLDAEAVTEAFMAFTHKHLDLTSQQIQFLSTLKAFICANGGLEIDRLYEAPFTHVSSDGIDGVFDDKIINELLDLISRFNLPAIRKETA